MSATGLTWMCIPALNLDGVTKLHFRNMLLPFNNGILFLLSYRLSQESYTVAKMTAHRAM